MAELAKAGYKAGTAYADNVQKEVRCGKGNEGTALELARAAEKCDRDIYHIEKSEQKATGRTEIRVWLGFGTELDGGKMPAPLHDLLTEWGWVPTRHHGPDKVAEQHVYLRESDISEEGV